MADSFSRSATFAYDQNGFLTSITDVVGLTSSVAYDTNGWPTTLTTPYGRTTFKITDGSSGAIIPNGRAVEITQPDGSQQLSAHIGAGVLLPGPLVSHRLRIRLTTALTFILILMSAHMWEQDLVYG